MISSNGNKILVAARITGTKVAALVYESAYAPDVGESANDASAPFGWTAGQKQIRLGPDNFATVTWEGVLDNIA